VLADVVQRADVRMRQGGDGAGLVDLTHSAFAQLGENLIGTQPRARCQRHGCSWRA